MVKFTFIVEKMLVEILLCVKIRHKRLIVIFHVVTNNSLLVNWVSLKVFLAIKVLS